ncbi:MAG: penicillin acylase family protein [Acidobacteriota bacterium]
MIPAPSRSRLVCALLLLAIPAAAENIEILRDAFGAPHIFAATPAGAAFGAGYAQAGDRTVALLANLRNAGEADPSVLSRAVRPIVNAYAAGINRYLEEHPELKAAPVSAANVAAYSRRAFQWIHGSNDLLLAPSRTTSKSVIAVLDPIADWNAPDRPYEMTLYATEGGLAMAGVAPPGIPFPVVGHTQFITVGWSGSPKDAGAAALDEAWSLLTARTLAEAHRALSMNQIPGAAFIGTAGGEIFDSGGASAAGGFLRRAGPSKNGDAASLELLRVQRTWPFGRVQDLAFSTDVYKADAWQARLAKSVPESKFARRLTGWNRRADADSVEALAFYLLKMELGPDAASLEPPQSLSDTRLRAALIRAQDRLEVDFDYGSKFGDLFRVAREGAHESNPVGGGVIPQAGMETARTIFFQRPASSFPAAAHIGNSGQAATRIVELSAQTPSSSILMPGVSDDPESTFFDDQARNLSPTLSTKPAYFRDRKELERHLSSRKQLIF